MRMQRTRRSKAGCRGDKGRGRLASLAAIMLLRMTMGV